MQFSTVNDKALIDAATTVVGPQATNAIIGLYRIIDKAMKDGYELGRIDGESNMDAVANSAFDNGWQHGEAEAKGAASFDVEEAQSAGWDNGYLAGVDDARARPGVADEIIIDILTDAAAAAYDADLVQDSGDVQPEVSALGA